MTSKAVSHQFRKLLIVGDNKDTTDLIEEVARVAGYDVAVVNDFRELKETYRNFFARLNLSGSGFRLG